MFHSLVSHSQDNHWRRQGSIPLSLKTITGESRYPFSCLSRQSLEKAGIHSLVSQNNHWRKQGSIPSSLKTISGESRDPFPCLSRQSLKKAGIHSLVSQDNHWRKQGSIPLSLKTTTGESRDPFSCLPLSRQSLEKAGIHSLVSQDNHWRKQGSILLSLKTITGESRDPFPCLPPTLKTITLPLGHCVGTDKLGPSRASCCKQTTQAILFPFYSRHQVKKTNQGVSLDFISCWLARSSDPFNSFMLWKVTTTQPELIM